MSMLSKSWTREELLAALNLYNKLAFGQLDQRNLAVIQLAEKLGRTCGSVAMKLVNFASLDPVLRLRGIDGLKGASRLDQSVWNEYHENFADSIADSEEILRHLFQVAEDEELEVSGRGGIRVVANSVSQVVGVDVASMTKQRRGQSFFRDAVLNNYDEQCAVSGIALRELLIASHILPWNSHPDERLDVRNGIALSRLHDAAFDGGWIAFDDNLCLLLSCRLKGMLSQRILNENFGMFVGLPLRIPTDALPPNPTFLAFHRMEIFRQ